MGWHLGIDFSWILVDFEGQVGAMLGSKIDQNSIQEGIEKRMRKRRRLGGVLEASWGPKNPPAEPQQLNPGRGGGNATPPLKEFQNFSEFVKNVLSRKLSRKEGKEGKKVRKVVRVWDSVRHAQAQGLARRIHHAAKLRTRHRAWAESGKK